jgi:hypothetical protein
MSGSQSIYSITASEPRHLYQQFCSIFGGQCLCSLYPLDLLVGLSLGGGAVRLSAGSPTAMKNSSCPAGVQSRRTGCSDLFLNE